MRIRLLMAALFLAALTSHAQKNLSGSRRSSLYTYVYRVRPRQALYLFRNDMDNWKTMVTNPVDSFTGDYPHLPTGDYIFVRAAGSDVEATLQSVGPLRFDLLSSGTGADLSLHTVDGKPITDAAVYTRHRRIRYNAASHNYPLGSWRGTRVISITEQGALYYFSVHSGTHSRFPWPDRWQTAPRFLAGFAMYRLRRLFPKKEPRSFFVFSKPKYKPGDTVRCKAFVLKANGRPVRRLLQIRLRDLYGSSVDTVLGRLMSGRPGAYHFSFVLTDSLDLTLDNTYHLSLEQSGKSFAGGNFLYEDYSLTALRLEARVDKSTGSPGDPVSLYVRAIDENDLPVPDGRVRIWVGQATPTGAFHRPLVFIPDTLWAHSQPLDPVGETRIILPDSIFPPVSMSYTIHCTLLNSDNESREKSFSREYLDDSSRIYMEPSHDSVRIDFRVRNRSRPQTAIVQGLAANGDLVTSRTRQLPITIPIDPFISEYNVEVPLATDTVQQSWTCEELHPALSLVSGRTADSVFLKVANPEHLHFWYSIAAGRRLIRRGYTDSLSYRERSVSQAPYAITLQYRWAARIYKNVYPLPFREKLLQVRVHQPANAYPGERTTIGIEVLDSKGRAVPDADLTAWAYTAKFNSPYIRGGIPYLGKVRKSQRQYSYSPPETETPEVKSPLDWRQWSRSLGLDTVEYYKFLNPHKLYVNRENVSGNLTQIAPFVTRKGQPEPVHLLYIDERPVYFSGTDQLARYSFLVDSGVHSLRLRTATSEIRLDSIRIAKGQKTFLSIDDDSANKAVRIRPMPDTLTAREQDLLGHSLIAVDNTFGYRYALLSQGSDRRYLLNTRQTYGQAASFLAGPFSANAVLLRVEDEFDQVFDPEGGNRFSMAKGLIKEKEWPKPYVLRSRLGHFGSPDNLLADRPITNAVADSLWQDFLDERSATIDFVRNVSSGNPENGAILFHLSDPRQPRKDTAFFVKKVFLFRYDTPDFMRIYAGQTRYLRDVAPGKYRLFLLLKAERYLAVDNLVVRPDGLNYFDIAASGISAPDSFSHRIYLQLRGQESYRTNSNSPALEPMQTSFNDRYLHPASLNRRVTGSVLDQAGHPLAGASVVLKGTSYGVVTNSAGFFELFTTDAGSLSISAVGYNFQTVRLKEPYTYEIRLKASTSALSEVVVIGYGLARKSDVTGSVNVVTADGLAGAAPGIEVRGLSSVFPPPEPAPDGGLPFNPDAGGNALRRHFRDDAWWLTDLHTDKNGTASFQTQLPDDITDWQTFVIAATDHRQTGFATGNIRSFKSLSAQLSTPSFLVQGDSARVIGKILNYMPDTIVVTRTMSIDGREHAEGEYRVIAAHLDSFLVTAPSPIGLPVPGLQQPGPDSVQLNYSIHRPDGYFDGEERSIPIYPAGSKEIRGSFSVLEGDTTIRLGFDTTLGPVHISATASVLPVMMDEINYLRQYEYGCNEQLASRLKALLEEKKLDHLLHRSFQGEKAIGDLIGKLMKARKQGLWGWWPEAEPAAWVTLHVAEALLDAERQGYKTALDKAALVDFLVYRLESAVSVDDRLFTILLLQDLQAKVDYRRYIGEAEKDLDRRDRCETLRLYEIRQRAGLDIPLDSLVVRHSTTALGSIYWGDDERSLFDNPIQETLLMYRLLRQAGAYAAVLPKIRNYFLERRGPGHWRNTYESSLILATLLPDLVTESAVPAAPSIRLGTTGRTGTQAPLSISSFPYETRFPGAIALTVDKRGSLPVYFTTWQQYWNPRPEKISGNFSVHSSFESNGHPVDTLTAGQPVTMTIGVTVNGEADFVLIEAPIPAGCSYHNKSQFNGSEEIHREYFKNKLSIFCGYLRKGRYEFKVSLLPRFTGVYRLNPARAEMMYFPTLNGRDEMRLVRIE